VRSVQSSNLKRSIGFDIKNLPSHDDVQDRVPKVAWLRYEFNSATLQSAPPTQIVQSYKGWQDWADSANAVRSQAPCCSCR
jgi:hypothetical protein